MTYLGKESKKRVDICTCITDPLCCRAEQNTVKSTMIKIYFKMK